MDSYWLKHLKTDSRAFDDYLEYLEGLSNEVSRETLSETSNPTYETTCRLQGRKKMVDRLKHDVMMADKEKRAQQEYLQKVK